MSTAEEYEKMSAAEKKKEDWMNAKWRPMMGWMYMIVCMCDFVLFPVMWSVLHAFLHTAGAPQWQPLTLQGAGLFHIAMGAVLGIAAFGRTQEKLGGANNGGIAPAGGFGGSNSFGSPSPSFGGGASQGFGSPSPSFNAPAPSFGGGAPAPSFGGGFNSPASSTPAVSKFGKVVPQQDDPVL